MNSSRPQTAMAEAVVADRVADRPGAATPETNTGAWVEDDAAMALSARQLARLEELREIGMVLARELGKRAIAPTTDHADGVDIALAFSRVARAVRQVVALEQEIVGLREQRRSAILDKRRFDNKQTVRRAVRNAMDADRPDLSHAQVNLNLQRIFNDYDDYGDFDYAAGNVGEIVAEICSDLGVEPPDPELWSGATLVSDDTPDEDEVPSLVMAALASGGGRGRNEIRNRPSGTGPPL